MPNERRKIERRPALADELRALGWIPPAEARGDRPRFGWASSGLPNRLKESKAFCELAMLPKRAMGRLLTGIIAAAREQDLRDQIVLPMASVARDVPKTDAELRRRLRSLRDAAQILREDEACETACFRQVWADLGYPADSLDQASRESPPPDTDPTRLAALMNLLRGVLGRELEESGVLKDMPPEPPREPVNNSLELRIAYYEGLLERRGRIGASQRRGSQKPKTPLRIIAEAIDDALPSWSAASRNRLASALFHEAVEDELELDVDRSRQVHEMMKTARRAKRGRRVGI